MQRKTIRTLLIVCVVLGIALVGVLVYDYFQNESALIVPVLGAFALFVLIAAILFFLAGRATQDEHVVVRVVEKEAEALPPTPQPMGDVLPPIPPAPLRSREFIAPVPPAKPLALVRAAQEPFVYNGYTLHTRTVQLNNEGGERRIYFFSKKKPKSGKPCPKPAGYHVGVNERTGLPFLKRGAGTDGVDLTPEAAEAGYRPQCSAVTADGAQCRNSAREASKYCGSHFGYQPSTTKGLAKRIEGDDWSADDGQTDSATVRESDTKARVKGAPDTKPSVRKSWFGRRRSSA